MSDISKLIKRLELIRNLIALEEVSDISSHAIRLNDFTSTNEIKNIVDLLEKKAFSKVIPLIEEFILKHNQLAIYIDPELEALKLETKILEKEVNERSGEKADLEKLIHEFGVRHNRELGGLILRILKHRKRNAEGTPQQEETEKDYENFNSEYQSSKDEKIFELTIEEQKELKQKYRMASKLCHPDVVSPDQKEQADKLFVELNEAYEKNDLQKVREILSNLERGDFFSNKSDIISEKNLLKVEIEKLRTRIHTLKNEISTILNSETYITIIKIDDWSAYFNDLRNKLSIQLKELESEVK
jgi:hypothetical protein